MPVEINSTEEKIRIPGGNISVKPAISPQQARAEAVAILGSGGAAKSRILQTTDYLFVGGVMSSGQLGVTVRTLQRYAKQRIVDRLPFLSAEVGQQLAKYDLQIQDQALYTLGPVGVEIVKMRHDVMPPTGFLAYPLSRAIHDVVVNEIVLRIANLAESHGWKSIWMSKYESSLMKDNHQILEPDAMLRLEKDDQEFSYLFEYHNEDKSTRALGKVRKYEAARHSGVWREAWETEIFPPVLAVFRDKIVAKGYQEGVAEQVDAGCHFYGRTLGNLLEDMEIWFDFNKAEKGKLFPWTEAA